MVNLVREGMVPSSSSVRRENGRAVTWAAVWAALARSGAEEVVAGAASVRIRSRGSQRDEGGRDGRVR